MEGSILNKQEQEKHLHQEKKHDGGELKQKEEKKREIQETKDGMIKQHTNLPGEAASKSNKIEENKLLERLQGLEKENEELKDRLLRKQADFENSRKRLQREKEESIKYANAMLLLDLTTIIDDFERAIQSAQDSQDFKAFHCGIELIEKQLTGMLENKWGLKRFESEGEIFNPDRHEAIMAEQSDKIDTPIVKEDFQRGYLLYDRILRPAKVKVAQPILEDKRNETGNQNKI
jgi:molecular chaperone GrpE